MTGSSARDRLLSRVVAGPDNCWVWAGSTNGNGYAKVWLPDGHNQYAHRASYKQFVGPIPDGLTLDHLCRRRNCINPAHLEPVTQGENCRRSGEATKTHCRHGHEYTPENTYWQPSSSGGRPARVCRTCRRDQFRQWYDKTQRVGRERAGHGSWSMYSRFKCRCSDCVAAGRAYGRECYRRQKERAGLERGAA